MEGSGLPADDLVDARVWSRNVAVPGAICDVDPIGERLHPHIIIPVTLSSVGEQQQATY